MDGEFYVKVSVDVKSYSGAESFTVCNSWDENFEPYEPECTEDIILGLVKILLGRGDSKRQIIDAFDSVAKLYLSDLSK